MEQQRDCTLDIAKAICICLMVIGHSGCPEYLHRFIYMFHMPCFFFISGWLLKDKYITDLKKGLFNKIKGSYYPFVKWSLIFLLFHNVFVWLSIYEEDYTLSEFGIKFIRILTMTGGEQLLGGFWFLISLCWASIFSLLFLYGLQKNNRLTYICISGGVFLTILIAFLESYLPVRLPEQFGEQTFLATAFYISGYLCHKLVVRIENMMRYGVTLLFVPAVVALFWRGSMQSGGWSVIAYYVIALAGSIGVIAFSKALSKYRLVSLFTYIGERTLYILIFHFLAFKLVSIAYIYYKDFPINCLVQFPVLKETNSYLWIFYSLIGMAISLLIWELFHLRTSSFKLIRFNK